MSRDLHRSPSSELTLYLGTHEVTWLARDLGPLLLSHRRLASRVKLPRAAVRWALDSGGFTELAMHGRWLTDPGRVRRGHAPLRR